MWCEKHLEHHHGKKRKDVCSYSLMKSIPFFVALEKMGMHSRRAKRQI